MTEIGRETRLLETFARLADTLIADFDVVDLLQLLVDACQDLPHTTAAGILLANPQGELELTVSTSEAARLVETMQLGAEAGPCIESFRTGQVVSLLDITTAPEAWSAFRDSALSQDFASVHAIPMRLREHTIGTLNLLRDTTGELCSQAIVAAQAFADVATIGILHERTLRERSVLAEQLQAALNSRVIIEQAKGVVAYTHQIPIDDAYTVIRDYARSHQLPIRHVAERLVNLTLRLSDPPGASSL